MSFTRSLVGPERVSATEHFLPRVSEMALFLSVLLAILTNMCSSRKVHRTARIALRSTPAQRRRCYGLLRCAGDAWAWVIDRNRRLTEQQRPRVANFSALCRELTGMSFGELSRHAAAAFRSSRLRAAPGRALRAGTADLPVATESAEPDRNVVAGIDLGIIHPYAVMAGDEGLLVSGRQIRAEERLHLEDTKRRAQKA